MKPITENEEFVAGMEERYQMEGLSVQDMAEVIIRRREYILGAKACQSILQKQHEGEDLKLLEWLSKQKCLNTHLSPARLLQLFRERDKGGS